MRKVWGIFTVLFLFVCPLFAMEPRVDVTDSGVSIQGNVTFANALKLSPGTAPANPTDGTLYMDSTGKLLVYFGGAWMSLKYEIEQQVNLPVAGAVLWLDASATNTFTLNGSGNISVWNDKTDNNHQAVATGYPEMVASEFNGQNVLRFDGTSYFTVSSLESPSVFSIFAVIRNPLVKTTEYGAVLGNAGWQAYGFQFGATIPDNFTPSYCEVHYSTPAAGSSASWVHEAGKGAGTAHVLSWILDENQHSLTSNNGFAHEMDLTGAPGDVTGIFVGSAKGPNGLNFKGDIAEVIIYDKVLTNSEKIVIENYLSNKWGGVNIH